LIVALLRLFSVRTEQGKAAATELAMAVLKAS
jgi:hypothetical protein